MVEQSISEHASAGTRRVLREAMELGRALDLIVATQGSGSPAVVPLVRELTATHKVLAGIFEGATGHDANSREMAAAAAAPQPMPETAPGAPYIDPHIDRRLEQTEARFNTLKESLTRLVEMLEKKEASAPPPPATTGSVAADQKIAQLNARIVELEREVARHRDVEVSLLTTMRDVRAASQAKSEFLANMSHELRTPLNAIIGFAEIIESELIGPVGSPKYIGYAKDVRESGQYLLELINDILDLSKIEAGQLEASEEEVDLRDAIEACIRMVKDQALEAELALTLEAKEDIPVIRANTRMIRQILLNLLSNAIKFTPSGGRITVKFYRDPATGDAVLQVQDTGVGIAANDLARVLRPFEQVESAQTRARRRGTGLGLPMAKSLVELHGGIFEIDSKVGVGTTVTIRLPAERVC